ncbi:hypothetical protein MKW98_012716 [Papaver atlanticum]|uniref:C2H2-type domain-containing protein n=1 Tax=Papaver atlanticum TaxID=357466 RepID=A0AAD4XJF3_9MAGN|nr:hypothetical protein MKW98_012716 [Papaver atlanticum]
MEEAPPTEPFVLHSSSSIYELDNSEKEYRNQEKEIDLNEGFSLNLELNLIQNFNVGRSLSSKDEVEENRVLDEEPIVFSCTYFPRKFHSSQALGGHQNAHKRERTIAKRDRHLHQGAAAAFSYANTHHRPYNHHYQFSSMGSLPLYCSPLSNGCSLGVQVHSTINKPSSSFLPSSSFGLPCHQHRFGQHHPGWTSSFRIQSMVEQRPSMLPSLVPGPMPRAPRFNNQEGVGGTFLLQGGGDGGGGRSSTASNQEGDLKNIDLSLKL